MRRLQKYIQKSLVVVAPVGASVLFLGAAFHGNGFMRVTKHVFRNIRILLPRTPSVLMRMWKERGQNPSDTSLAMSIAILSIGWPFVLTLILLDDFEE